MKFALTVAAMTAMLIMSAAAQNQCYRDSSGNVRCLDGTTIYNKGNGCGTAALGQLLSQSVIAEPPSEA